MSKNDLFGTKSRTSKGAMMVFRDNRIYSEMQDLTKSERAVLDVILKEMAENLNTVFISGFTKAIILDKTNIKESSLKPLVHNLVKGGFIEKTAIKNEYIVNPLLAMSGSFIEVMNNYKRIENELRKKKGIKPLPR